VWSLDQTVEKTSEWYCAYLERNEVISNQQLVDYVNAAVDAKVGWIES
jgi:hypothetical protein